MKKEAINLSKRKEEYIGGFKGGNRGGNDVTIL